MKKRESFIDIVRAVAMTFIVLGHTIVHSEHCGMIFKFIYSFHVILFFIISGYTINQNKKFSDFFKNKFLRIMVPYFVWGTLFLLPYLFIGKSVGENFDIHSSYNLKELLLNILYGNGNALKQNSALWFLPSLFSMEIFFYGIVKINNYKKGWKDGFLLILLILIGGISSKYIKIIFPWGINTVLNCGYFFFIGYLIKKYQFIKVYFNNFHVNLFSFIIGTFACFLNPSIVSCIDYQYGNYFFTMISSLGISLFIIRVCYIINKNHILEFIGKNTLSILIFHKLIILIFQTKLGVLSRFLTNSNLFLELFLGVVVSVFAILTSLGFGMICKKIIPILIGEKSI